MKLSVSRLLSRACLLVSLAASTAQAQVVYVSASAPAGGDGSSWSSAFQSLADGLAFASFGDRVFVAEGVYRPDQGSFKTLGDREETFKLSEGVSIYGGFVGTESDPLLREGSAAATILTGDLNGDDLPGFTNRGDNSYHVVRGRGITSLTVIDGFTIQGGNADGGATEPVGGGIYNASLCSPTVRDCTIRDNRASDSGGGVANRLSSSPVFENCVIEDNYAEIGGGGWYDFQNGAPILSGVSFLRNESGSLGGGAYSLSNCTPSFMDCVFEENYAAGNGGAYRNEFSSLPSFDECTFTGNVAGDFAGALDNDGMTYTLRGCEFVNNVSGLDGGGVRTTADMSFVACTWIDNQAGAKGGAIVCTELSATLTVLRCLIRGNSAVESGGGIHMTANLFMENSALTQNSAGTDGAAICL
ncbi:MAG: right-handed parallel beta-helix repeat-containing protein, partial [Planctomycetota bacterium]